MPLLWCRCMRRSEAECMESSSGEWQGKSLHRGQLEKLHSLWARYVRDSIPLLAWASKFFRYIRLIKFPRFQQQMLLNLGTEKSRPLMCIVHSGCRTSGSIWKTREYHLVCHRLIHHGQSHPQRDRVFVIKVRFHIPLASWRIPRPSIHPVTPSPSFQTDLGFLLIVVLA